MQRVWQQSHQRGQHIFGNSDVDPLVGAFPDIQQQDSSSVGKGFGLVCCSDSKAQDDIIAVAGAKVLGGIGE